MNDEKKFLHDLANPAATALIIIDNVVENEKIHLTRDPKEISQLETAVKCLKQIQSLIKSRRLILLEQND